jgi:hypothetical protein
MKWPASLGAAGCFIAFVYKFYPWGSGQPVQFVLAAFGLCVVSLLAGHFADK